MLWRLDNSSRGVALRLASILESREGPGIVLGLRAMVIADSEAQLMRDPAFGC